MLIGREAAVSKVVIPHPQVSSAHAWIGWNGTSIVFVDRGSTNGSTINGSNIRPGDEILLDAGDVVSLGRDDAVCFMVERY
ncbi:MAG: FHA domain-containing protein [Myxococcota bacterium]